jgi:uncharacterized protein (DUF58 family)
MAARAHPASGKTDPARAEAIPPSYGEPLHVVNHRYHLHLPGIVYVAVTVLLAMGAIRSQNNLLFLAFGAAVAGIFISGVLSGAALMGLQLWRDQIDDVAVGGRAIVRYRLHNRNMFFPSSALVIEESPGDEWKQATARPVAFVAYVSPSGDAIVEATPEALRRGVVNLDVVRVWTTYPFGLTRKSVTFRAPARIVVTPRIISTPVDVFGRLESEDARAVSAARGPGRGDDFYGLREYEAGDHPRQIAWRVSARTGELLVRQHAARQPQRLWVRLARTPAGTPAREAVVSLAASLVDRALRLGWAAGIIWSDAGVEITPRTGARHRNDVLRSLAIADANNAPAAATMRDGRTSDAVIDVTSEAASRLDAGRLEAPGRRQMAVSPEEFPELGLRELDVAAKPPAKEPS